MINARYYTLLEEVLENDQIFLRYDKFSTRSFIAELIHFLLFFGIALGIICRKLMIAADGNQYTWDFVLAIVLLFWSIFVLLRALVLKPVKGEGIIINKSGISAIKRDGSLIPWCDLAVIYPLPWVVVFRGRTKQSLWIGFFLKNFPTVTQLFGLLVTSHPKSQIKAFEKEMKIKSKLESLKALNRFES